MVVDGACLCNNLRFLGECCGKEVGVDCDAVSSYAATRLQDVDARVLVCQGDKFPDIYACAVAYQGQLVGESYLHVA